MTKKPRELGRLGRLWWSSLPLRVVVSTLAASILVLVGGGVLLLQQATAGIIEGKQQSAVAEANVALDRMQNQLADSELGGASVYERITQIAFETANRDTQYSVIVEGPVSSFLPSTITAASVPDRIRESVRGSESLWLTPTELRYVDDKQPPEPGIVVAGNLVVPQQGMYPIYFLFPMTTETATLTVLRQAILSAGTVLLVALAAMAYLVSRTIVSPVRRARLTAQSLAAGNLDDRMQVRGTDDFAALATSMNDMAQKLQTQITELEDLSRVQQQFVSDVSHELRTPLTTVRMAAELLYEARDSFEPATSRSAELLSHELDRFESLLSDLLEISRFDAGAAVLTLDEVDVVEIAADEVSRQAAFAETQNTELELVASEPCVAQVDARRVQRILRNLITNAIEHGEGKPVEVEVAEDEQAVAVVVRDHGVG